MTNDLSYRDQGRGPSAEAAFCASIAHEINQPLAAIVADASACRRWLAASPPNRERIEIIVERILECAVSASQAVHGLRMLYTVRDTPLALAQLNDVVREVCAQVAPELAGIEFALRLDPGLPMIALDRAQIRQVLVNLVRNGAEAMETSRGRRRIELCSRLGKDEIQVEVCDWGSGVVDPERIFAPLFSTKANGMGMGLAICRQIVEAHGGRLWTAPGEPVGTRMIFVLPIGGMP